MLIILTSSSKIRHSKPKQRNKKKGNKNPDSMMMLCRYPWQYTVMIGNALHISVIVAKAAEKFRRDCGYFRGEVFMGIIILDSMC